VYKLEVELRKIMKLNYKNKLPYFVHRRGKLRKGKTTYFCDTIRTIMRSLLSLGGTDSSGMRVSIGVDAIVRILIMGNSISSGFWNIMCNDR
jgi:hypothetical protein